ncbi:MAG TPA: carboxypeptidase regulatory-like domain-containing protein [Bryobacteraceae bacterium]|nr:carboxypeptidase regulatory-like domain-containing protein [Bryobacteraceae bacterium]
MFAEYPAILAAASVLAAQTAPEPASIAGTVSNSVTGEPILRAHVSVNCPAGNRPQREPQVYGALTNEKGEFSIAPLPPRNCWVSAERAGFVSGDGSETIPLSSGTHKEGVQLTLIPTGSITGRVVNAEGEPMDGINVSAQMSAGNSGNATTDEKGEFRVGGLYPGKYRVRATPQKPPFPPEIRSDGTTEQNDAATYYPDSLDAKSAQRVEVKAGAEVTGIEIKLLRTPFTKVSGSVTGIPPGIQNVMVIVQPPGQASTVGANGTFTMWRLDPGKYTLHAQHWGGQTRLLSAPVEIEVAGTNIEHVELRMVPPFEIAGLLRFDDEEAREAPKTPTRGNGSATPAPPAPPRRLDLIPLDNQFGQMGGGAVAADDSFTLERVQPGRYHVEVQGVSGFVKSIRAGDTEVEGSILDVRNGSPGPVTLTLSSNYCEISGAVSDSNGPLSNAIVMLAPVEGRGQTQTTHSDSGTYKFRVPPGKYKLAIVDETMVWRMQGADLDEYNPESVELSAGDKITKDLVQRKQ